MKRILATIMVVMLSLGFIGCENSEKQETLLQYLNEDRNTLIDLESDFLESYNGVTGNNFTSDEETLTELTTNTITLARNLSKEATDLSFEISDDEILDAHRLYMDYSSKMLNAVGMMIAALENQDRTQVVEANELLNEANNLALDYQRAIMDLAEKYNVEIIN